MKPTNPYFQFKNKKLLKIALTHRSVLNEKKHLSSNERLEFLGDAVLELVISDYLFKKYQKEDEGKLTHRRAQIVQTKTLSYVARQLKLDQYIFLSKGESQSGGQKNTSILADCFEAIIGAIYLDQGLDKVTQFIHQYLLKPLPKILKSVSVTDYKSLLQEKWQKLYQTAPSYKLLHTKGPEHNKVFTVAVFLNKKLIAKGTGASKQKAQIQAAAMALEKK